MVMKPAGHTWSGRLFVSGGYGLYVGAVEDLALHSHHAVKFCFALEGAFSLRTRRDGIRRSYRAAAIASNQPHQV
ncbi:MAG: hypothetical protein ACREQ9_09135, partial [Candidatus Binatia bacterium]